MTRRRLTRTDAEEIRDMNADHHRDRSRIAALNKLTEAERDEAFVAFVNALAGTGERRAA